MLVGVRAGKSYTAGGENWPGTVETPAQGAGLEGPAAFCTGWMGPARLESLRRTTRANFGSPSGTIGRTQRVSRRGAEMGTFRPAGRLQGLQIYFQGLGLGGMSCVSDACAWVDARMRWWRTGG